MPPPPPAAALMEKLRLLLVRERELNGLRQEYQAYRSWMERVQTVTLRLATHTARDTALAELVRALVGDFAFEYAAAIGDDFRFTAGEVRRGSLDEQVVARAVAQARATGAVEVTMHAAADELSDDAASLAWLRAGSVRYDAATGGGGELVFVLLVGRTGRTAAFYPPPWDREIERFRHLLDTVAHVVAAVDFRAALIGERNNLRGEVERATGALTEALAQAESARREAVAASEAKSGFLASMSHELRTPLNALVGYAELVMEGAAELGAEELLDDARRLQAAGAHLSSVVTNILDISKIEANKMDLTLGTFRVVPLVEEALAIAAPLAAQGGNHLAVEVDADPGGMYADAVKLRQILVNLLSNACKFTRNGEIVVRVGFDAGRQRVSVEVTDTGVGMSEEQLSRLFDNYTRVHKGAGRPEGTGLGLVICRSFARMMGGDVAVTSAPGAGTTFTVELPARVIPLAT